jgi:phosphopantothenoylcysteine decarboxylase / phosphopantothenate---cysteine ligase
VLFRSYILLNLPKQDSYFKNKNVLVTLGGTIEDIDPVRYISNKSSGRMGFSFAEEFILRGSAVTIICGNTSDLGLNKFQNKFKNVKIIPVRSAADMKKAVFDNLNNFDIYLMASAVADYTVEKSEQKIKKSTDIKLDLLKTEDILKNLPKRNDAVYIGFAAESENLIENAKIKLSGKKLDFIIANQVTGEKQAIGSDKAEVYLLNKWNESENKFEYDKKVKIAKKVLDCINEILNNR